MPRKSYKPEEIVAKRRQVDVLMSQGQSTADAIRPKNILHSSDVGHISEWFGLSVSNRSHNARKICFSQILEKLGLQESHRFSKG